MADGTKQTKYQSSPLRTPDGRYIIVRGRLWRATNPDLPAATRQALTKDLMAARRTIGAAASSAPKVKAARQAVHAAKVALGERGPVWWQDGTPDFNRHLVRNSPYAGWFAVQDIDSFRGGAEPNDSQMVLSKEPIRERPMAAKKKTKKTAKKSARKTAKKTTKRSTRGRSQDRARVAAGQDYEVAYEAKKTKKKASSVRKAVKKVGNSRKKVNKALRGR